MKNRLLIPVAAAAALLFVLAGAVTALIVTGGDERDSTTKAAAGVPAKGYLGVTVAYSSAAAGLRVTSVEADGPAARAGLEVGDVIRSVDGVVVRTPEQLKDAVESRSPGTSVSITYERGDREFQARALLADAPAGARIEPPPSLPPETGQPRRQLGVRLEQVTPALRQQYNLSRDQGVVVVEVAAGGPAANAGMEPGDLLLAVAGRSVSTPEEVSLILNATTENTLPVTILRGESQATLSVDLTPPMVIPGLDGLPPHLREQFQRALEHGTLSPEQLQQLQRLLRLGQGGASFGVVREVTSNSLVIRPLERPVEVRYAINDRTEFRRGATAISPAALEPGESVIVLSFDGQAAFAVLSLGRIELPPGIR
jgi:membrane-associated protease RseP (regulator of RpoE activity)